MGYNAPAIHRKCYFLDCKCKNARYASFREACAHCDSCVRAQKVYYDQTYGKPICVYEKARRPYEEMKPVEPGKNRRLNPADAIRPGSIQGASE